MGWFFRALQGIAELFAVTLMCIFLVAMFKPRASASVSDVFVLELL